MNVALYTALAIASIYKSNLSLFSRYELARTLIGSSFSRAAYTLAAERALINNTNTEATKKGFGIIDALFENNFSLIKEIATTIPVKIAETIGHDLALAALSRHFEMKLVEFMADLEMKDSTDANKNMIFRGNAISSRTIMAFIKICSNQWIMSIYQPVTEYVLHAYKDGQSFNIKADRLLSGENLEKNRISYRISFLKVIDVITTAIPHFPIQIIHMLQIVFNKVNAKFGDHGTMILNGILFLRFIIPTFTTTPTDCVGISEEARQGLVNLSVGLMAAALRGNLKEKGPDFEIFNDVAALALDRFSASSRHIISMDLKQAASKWIEVDERIVSESLTNSFAKFFNELTTRLNKETQGRKMTLAENTLLSTVYQVVDTPKTERPKRNVDDVYSSSGTMIKDYLSIPISAEEKEKLDSWLFNDTPELNDFDVLYLVTEKQPDVNPKLLIAHALRQMGEINDKFYFVADLSNFTQAQIPRLLILKKIFAFLPTTVKNNLQKIIIIRSSIDFVEYYTTNKQNIPFAEKISFAEDIDGISPIVVLSLKLPEENNEVLNHEGTPLLTTINDRKALIRLGRTSLFYSFNINGVHSNGALIYTKIKYLSALKALQNIDDAGLEFTITDDAGNTLKFTTTPASSLYHLVVSAYSRVHIRPTKYPSIFTDSSDSVSTKWLLFLIGLICVQETDCEYLSGTGLSLLESTVKAYNFPIKVPSKPESTAKNARDIMNKASEAISQEARPFIVDFLHLFVTEISLVTSFPPKEAPLYLTEHETKALFKEEKSVDPKK